MTTTNPNRFRSCEHEDTSACTFHGEVAHLAIAMQTAMEANDAEVYFDARKELEELELKYQAAFSEDEEGDDFFLSIRVEGQPKLALSFYDFITHPLTVIGFVVGILLTGALTSALFSVLRLLS